MRRNFRSITKLACWLLESVGRLAITVYIRTVRNFLLFSFSTGTPPLTRFFGPWKNCVKGKPRCRRSILILQVSVVIWFAPWPPVRESQVRIRSPHRNLTSGLLSFKKPETVLWTIAKHYYYLSLLLKWLFSQVHISHQMI